MKKIVYALVIMFGFIPKVWGDDFIWSTEKRDDLEFVSEEKRYKYYKEEKVGEYITKGIINTSYEFEDTDNVKYGEISEYKEVCDNSNGKTIEYLKVYPYKEVPSIRYFKLTNIKEELKVKNINIYYGSKEVKYEISECNKCNGMTIGNDGYMLLRIFGDYTPRSLTIEINTDNDNYFTYTGLIFADDKSTIMAVRLYSTEPICEIKKYGIMSANLGEIKYSEVPLESKYEIVTLEAKDVCVEKEILTFRYNKVRTYYDDNYHIDIDDSNYMKDEDSFITYYKYLNNDVLNDNNSWQNYLVDTGVNSEKTKGENKFIIILVIYILLFCLLFYLISIKIRRKLSK